MTLTLMSIHRHSWAHDVLCATQSVQVPSGWLQLACCIQTSASPLKCPQTVLKQMCCACPGDEVRLLTKDTLYSTHGHTHMAIHTVLVTVGYMLCEVSRVIRAGCHDLDTSAYFHRPVHRLDI